MFRLLGFPVQIRPGFIVFMALIVVVNGGEFGLWLAGAITVFTLVHELGHAVVARSTGAKAEISLDFMAGYASYVPSRPLRRYERAGIAFAGPAVQIILGLGVLAAMGVNPLDHHSFNETAASAAIWWAGPVIGLLNLAPVLPLDGGNIVLAGLDAIFPGRARPIMVWASIAVTAGVGLVLFADPRWRTMAVYPGILVVIQLQMLDRRPPAVHAERALAHAAEAEAAAWHTGRPDMMLGGQQLSPWYRAHVALQSGRPDDARAMLVDAFTPRQPARWALPVAASAEQLRPLVALLPQPLPTGDPQAEYALAEVLHRLGLHDQAARYAAASYTRRPSAMVAALVARAAAALGDADTAVRWLQAAASVSTSPGWLARTIDEAPELITLRAHPQVDAIRRQLTGV